MKKLLLFFTVLFVLLLSGCQTAEESSVEYEHFEFNSTEESLSVESETIVDFFFGAPVAMISNGEYGDYRFYRLSVKKVDKDEDGDDLSEPYALLTFSGMKTEEGVTFEQEKKIPPEALAELQRIVKSEDLTKYHGIYEYTLNNYGWEGVEISVVYDTGEEIWCWRNDLCIVPYKTVKAFLEFALNYVGETN